MTKQRELLNELANLDALQDQKKAVVRDLNEDIKAARKTVVRLRSELEAESGRDSSAKGA
jgi:uncharacterized protein YlxW (UPF0749 family)